MIFSNKFGFILETVFSYILAEPFRGNWAVQEEEESFLRFYGLTFFCRKTPTRQLDTLMEHTRLKNMAICRRKLPTMPVQDMIRAVNALVSTFIKRFIYLALEKGRNKLAFAARGPML
jgi:hypothetical protein